MDVHGFMNSSIACMVSQGKMHSGFSMEDLQDHDACMHQFVLDHGDPGKLCSWFSMESVFMVFHGICAYGFPWNLCSWVSMESAVLRAFHGTAMSWFPREDVLRVCHGIYAQDFPGKLWSVQARFPREPSLQDVSKNKVLY